MTNFDYAERTYRFACDLRCFAEDGDTHVLREFEVPVTTTLGEDYARSLVEETATDMVHDEGSRLLDFPLDHLEVIRVTLERVR